LLKFCYVLGLYNNTAAAALTGASIPLLALGLIPIQRELGAIELKLKFGNCKCRILCIDATWPEYSFVAKITGTYRIYTKILKLLKY